MRENAARAAEVLGEILADAGARAQDRIAAARVVLTAAGPLYPGPGWLDTVEDRGVVDAPRELREYDRLVLRTANEAARMAGRLGVTRQTPGAAWAESGLETSFPGSFAQLQQLADNPCEADAFCSRILADWQEALDLEAIDDANEDGVDD